VGSTNLRARQRWSARSSQRRKSARSSLWHEKSKQEGRTRTEMNRSRSTASSCTARHARPPVVRDRPAREGLESTHRRGLEASRSWSVRGTADEGGQEEERGGRGRTCSPAAAEPICPASSASCTFSGPVEGRPLVYESPSVSREVGRRGALMRTRRGGSAPGARAAGGAGDAQRCWRVVQVASRGPSRVPSREGERERSEEEHKPGALDFL